MKRNELVERALAAREHAYAPYSTFQVGAALLSISGRVYTGANVENSSYSLTCCAERTAIFKAITEGERNFVMMAIVANSEKPVSPCGACRQVMSEFFPKEMPIYLANVAKEIKEVTVEELLPYSFHL